MLALEGAAFAQRGAVGVENIDCVGAVGDGREGVVGEAAAAVGHVDERDDGARDRAAPFESERVVLADKEGEVATNVEGE